MNNDKNIELFDKHLIDIFLKIGRSIKTIKEYNSILDWAIPSTKHCFLLITFSNFYPMISTNKIQLDKLLGIAYPAQ